MTTTTWTGGTGNYVSDANWSDNHAPQGGDTGVFSAGTIQIGSVTIAASTTLLVGNGDYTTPLHVQLTNTTVDGLFHAVAGGANGDAEDYDLSGTVTLNGSIAAAQDYGLLDINDLTGPATLVVAATGTISSSTGSIPGSAADLNIAVSTLVNNGLISMTDAYGHITSATVSGTGAFSLAGTGDAIGLSFDNAVGSGITVQFAAATPAELVLSDPANFAGTVVGLAQLEDIQLNNIQADAAVLSGGTLTITNGGSLVAAITVAGAYPGGFTVNHTAFYGNPDAASSFIRAVACFATGTHIATPDGGIAVESLRPGDLIALARGGAARVQWLGHRHIDCRRHPRRHDVLPVRVHAHAFGRDLPARDLLLSPDHSVHVDGMLIPVRFLINGRSVARETVEEITYHHVELPAHDVLLAEGLPCETYLDTGNRAAFADDGPAIVSAM